MTSPAMSDPPGQDRMIAPEVAADPVAAQGPGRGSLAVGAMSIANVDFSTARKDFSKTELAKALCFLSVFNDHAGTQRFLDDPQNPGEKRNLTFYVDRRADGCDAFIHDHGQEREQRPEAGVMVSLTAPVFQQSSLGGTMGLVCHELGIHGIPNAQKRLVQEEEKRYLNRDFDAPGLAHKKMNTSAPGVELTDHVLGAIPESPRNQVYKELVVAAATHLHKAAATGEYGATPRDVTDLLKYYLLDCAQIATIMDKGRPGTSEVADMARSANAYRELLLKDLNTLGPELRNLVPQRFKATDILQDSLTAVAHHARGFVTDPTSLRYTAESTPRRPTAPQALADRRRRAVLRRPMEFFTNKDTGQTVRLVDDRQSAVTVDSVDAQGRPAGELARLNYRFDAQGRRSIETIETNPQATAAGIEPLAMGLFAKTSETFGGERGTPMESGEEISVRLPRAEHLPLYESLGFKRDPDRVEKLRSEIRALDANGVTVSAGDIERYISAIPMVAKASDVMQNAAAHRAPAWKAVDHASPVQGSESSHETSDRLRAMAGKLSEGRPAPGHQTTPPAPPPRTQHPVQTTPPPPPPRRPTPG